MSDYPHHYAKAIHYSHEAAHAITEQLTHEDLGEEQGRSHNRGALADALDEIGRHEEAAHARGHYPIWVDNGTIKRAPTARELTDFQHGHLTAALWQATDDDEGDPLLNPRYHQDPENHDRVHPRDRAEFHQSASDFLHQHRHLFDDDTDWEQAGHDLALSRNGHGAGYFDGPYTHADELQRHARNHGEYEVYADPDPDTRSWIGIR